MGGKSVSNSTEFQLLCLLKAVFKEYPSEFPRNSKQST